MIKIFNFVKNSYNKNINYNKPLNPNLRIPNNMLNQKESIFEKNS